MVWISLVLYCEGFTQLLQSVVLCPSPDLGNFQSLLLKVFSQPRSLSPCLGPQLSKVPHCVPSSQVPEALFLFVFSLLPCEMISIICP